MPSVNPQCLEEFQITFKLFQLKYFEILLNYLEKCPKLKTLTIHIWKHDDFGSASPVILKTILGSKLKKVEKVHLTYRCKRLGDGSCASVLEA